MPQAVIPFIPLITGGAAVGTSIYATKRQSSAQERAARTQQASNEEALRFERELEERRRKEYDEAEAYNRALSEREIAREQARYESEWAEAMRRYEGETAEERQRYQAKETRLAPYRQVGTAALGDLARLNQQAAPNAPAMVQAPPLPEGMRVPRPPISSQVSPAAAGAPPPSYGAGAVNDSAGLALSMTGDEAQLSEGPIVVRPLAPEQVAGLNPRQLQELQARGLQVPMSTIARVRPASVRSVAHG